MSAETNLFEMQPEACRGPGRKIYFSETTAAWMAQEIRMAVVIFPRSRELLAPVLAALSAGVREQEEKP